MSHDPAIDRQLPRISIVVPNYNSGGTLGDTLQSLVDQKYPNLEIIVVDGGSTDHSVEVIKRYEKHIAWWISEKDRGQSDAINKGFARATGEIVNWLCSDDTLLPGALHTIARAFGNDTETDVVTGRCQQVYPKEPARNHSYGTTPKMIKLLPCCNTVPQPGCFFRRSLLNRKPIIDETLHYAMDLDLWMYFVANGARWKIIPDDIAIMVNSGENKSLTGGNKIVMEIETIYKRWVPERIPLTYWHRRLRYPLERVRHHRRGWLFGLLLYYPYQCIIILFLAPFYGFNRVRHMNWADIG